MTGAAGWDRPGRMAVAPREGTGWAIACGLAGGTMSWWAGVARWGRAYRLDIIWVAFGWWPAS